jgi:hypothetical protein
VPFSLAIIFVALTLAFSKSVREFADTIRKIACGIIVDLLRLPVIVLSGKQKRNVVSMPKGFTEILKRYTITERQEVVEDDDIWKEYEYRLPLHNTEYYGPPMTPRRQTTLATLRAWNPFIGQEKDEKSE